MGIIFGPLFFPSSDPTVSLALSLARFALAFVVRPVGGIQVGLADHRIRTRVNLHPSVSRSTVAIV